jgi:glucan phosphorylase
MILAEVKRQNKLDFCKYYKDNHHHDLNPDSIFDFQAKRIMNTNASYSMPMISFIDPRDCGRQDDPPPHLFFAGKAAPGYFTAKLIIRLIAILVSISSRILSWPVFAGNLPAQITGLASRKGSCRLRRYRNRFPWLEPKQRNR